jgi:hypothetical protein
MIQLNNFRVIRVILNKRKNKKISNLLHWFIKKFYSLDLHKYLYQKKNQNFFSLEVPKDKSKIG